MLSQEDEKWMFECKLKVIKKKLIKTLQENKLCSTQVIKKAYKASRMASVQFKQSKIESEDAGDLSCKVKCLMSDKNGKKT